MSARLRVRNGVASLAVLIVLNSACAVARAEAIAIVGGKVYTMGDAGTVENGTVIIEDGRIVAAGSDVSVSEDTRRIDAAGKTVTPGIFDAHSYIGIVEISLVQETNDSAQIGNDFAAAFDVADAINPRSSLIPVNRIEGVTRAATAPVSIAPPPGSFAQGKVIAGRGAVIHLGGGDDYLVRRGAATFAVLGEAGQLLAGGSRAAAILRLREALEDARDFAGNRASYESNERRDYAIGRLDLEALQDVLNRESPLVLAVNRASDIKRVIELKDNFAIDVVVLGGAEGWLVADDLAEAEVPVILDPYANLPTRFETIAATLENAARLHRAGVTVAFSSSDSHNARNLKQAAGNAVAYGMPYEAALAAMTVNPARIYGVEDSYGTLEPGMDADVVIWDGDPLEVTTFAEKVFIRGEEMPMVSRSTLLRDRYLDRDNPLPPAYRTPGPR
ncbi:MAG: amidohydrolase family protein [Gammaproteobacteria bacterium]